LIVYSFIEGSGFALHVQQKEKQKMYHKQYPAAAQLIQAAWRMHATSRLQHDNATWRLYRLVDPVFGLLSILYSFFICLFSSSGKNASSIT
jgi:hypothetical protein